MLRESMAVMRLREQSWLTGTPTGDQPTTTIRIINDQRPPTATPPYTVPGPCRTPLYTCRTLLDLVHLRQNRAERSVPMGKTQGYRPGPTGCTPAVHCCTLWIIDDYGPLRTELPHKHRVTSQDRQSYAAVHRGTSVPLTKLSKDGPDSMSRAIGPDRHWPDRTPRDTGWSRHCPAHFGYFCHFGIKARPTRQVTHGADAVVDQ